jgi:Flp pilus assembly protein TadD
VVCDVTADFALGREDYSTAVTLHRELLSSHPNDALAHYHLGFAYGMVGRAGEEISEYLAAVNLGLDKWDLFLNLGLAFLGQHELAKATAALETAVLLGPEHAETHFNLALVYERQNRLQEALQEITTSRRLAPEDLDAANTNGIICAEMGDLSCAHDVWTHLVQAVVGKRAAESRSGRPTLKSADCIPPRRRSDG